MINKLILAAIAIGLWANAATFWLKPAQAQSDFIFQSMNSNLSGIDMKLGILLRGGSGCRNNKICD